ncbi:MAG: hypothetical protein H6601_09165 [Flavobacteriales bacterium]|nr:hypothetical protein [Flavobacteriales bacterium]
MAKLVTTKEKYGISVATRIDPEMAHQISERAERLGVSFAKMLGILVSKGFNPQEPIYIENREEEERLNNRISELESEVEELRDDIDEQSQLYRNTAAELINQVAVNDTEKIAYSELYNQILNEQRDGF